jgi:heme/copper-type cytochrome/quinol oxidase subunit 2
MSLMLSAVENSRSVSASRVSSTSASRKLEFIALAIPVSGVVAVNQLVLAANFDAVFSVFDFTGVQWYWVGAGADMTLVHQLAVGQLLGLTAANSALLTSGAIFLLTAVDVIHAIALPTLAVKADAIPGRVSVARLQCEVSGSYQGQCSELCGAMHAFMPMVVVETRGSRRTSHCRSPPSLRFQPDRQLQQLRRRARCSRSRCSSAASSSASRSAAPARPPCFAWLNRARASSSRISS